MSHKNPSSYIVIAIVSLIALTVVTAASFNHNYLALAVSKSKKSSGASGSSSGTSTLGGSGGSSSSSAATPASPNTLTKKELSSFISCLNTANKSEGLTHKIVTNCLDIARGLTTGTAAAAAAAAATAGGTGKVLGSSSSPPTSSSPSLSSSPSSGTMCDPNDTHVNGIESRTCGIPKTPSLSSSSPS